MTAANALIPAAVAALILTAGVLFYLIRLRRRRRSLIRTEACGDPARPGQMLTLIIDNIPFSVFWKDAAGRYLGANRRFVQEAGFDSAEELIGRTDDELPSSESARFFRRDDRRVLERGEPVLHRQEPVPGDGSFFRYMRTSKIPIPGENGTPVAVLGLFEDVTEERERNLRMENSERKYRALFENSNDAIVIHDAAGDILEVNQSAARLFGYPKEELESVNIRTLAREEARIEDLIEEIRRRNNVRREDLLFDRHGRALDVEVSASLLDSRAGIVQVIIRDISNRKLAERRLQEAKQQAEEANKAKNLFIANMSHEIRTPMNAILGFTEILRREVLGDEYQSYLKIIENSGRTLLGLINDILDLSKIEAGRLELNPTSVDLRALVREVADVFSVACEGKGVDLRVQIDPTVPASLMVDTIRLRQILLNLVGNAVKFTDTGYVAVEATVREHGNGSLDLSLSVADSGCGIPEDQHEEIFQAFRQRRGQDFNRFGGTGLGLTIIRRLTTMMGGEVSLESVPGRGSRFTVVLRELLPGETAGEEAERISTPPRLEFGGGAVLSIDDVELNHLLLERYLATATDLTLIRCGTAEEALRTIRRRTITAAVVDLNLPGMRDFDLVRTLRSDPRGRGVPIIGVTASMSERTREDAIRAGADRILVKPFGLESLLQTLGALVPVVGREAAPAAGEQEPNPEQIDRGSADPSALEALDSVLQRIGPAWCRLRDSYYTDDLERFGRQVAGEASARGLDSLAAWGRRLMASAEAIDVVAMEEALKEFPAQFGRTSEDLKELCE